MRKLHLKSATLGLVLSALGMIWVGGCDEAPKPVVEAGPTTFSSAAAPFALTLDGAWKLEDPKGLNEFADLAASYKGTLYMIVIPQRLPQIPDVEPPNALALRRASVSVMEEQIQDFRIERQGPVRVAGEMGQTVFANGMVDGAQVKYVTTYLTRDAWGFQIVAWGPATKTDLLVSEIDRVLASWRFTDTGKTGALPAPEKASGEAESP